MVTLENAFELSQIYGEVVTNTFEATVELPDLGQAQIQERASGLELRPTGHARKVRSHICKIFLIILIEENLISVNNEIYNAGYG